MNNDLVINNLFRSALGMQSLIDRLNTPQSQTAFPPYNISVDNEQSPSKYTLEMAIAGFGKDQISVKLRKEQGVNYLVISGEKSTVADKKHYLARGLAARSFEREFTVADGILVDSVALENGILTIELSVTEPFKSETILQIK